MNVGSLAFAGCILAVGVAYEWMALAMPRGTLSYPGPGLYPVLVGVLLVATAAGCILQELLAWRRSAHAAVASEAPATTARRHVAKAAQLAAVTVGYILALKPLGYPLAILGFLLLAIRIFGSRRWLPTVAVASVVTALSYVAFVVWLKVPLPLGILDEILG